MVDGRVANAVPDTAAEPEVASLPATEAAGIGAYVGVPLRLPDGRLYGALCCIDRDAQPHLGEADVRLLHMLARLVGEQLDEMESARAAERAQREQFALISHDLRAPLSIIRGFGELLAARADSDDVGTAAELIVRNARKLDRMVEDLLLLARTQAGALVLDRRPLDLRTVVSAALQDAGEAASEAGVTLGSQLPAQPVAVLGDELRLAQLLDNLLSNAIKYSPGGGTVTVRLGRQRTTAVLEVHDQGIGIAPEELEHLFERFYRASTARRHAIPGLGLGLAICQSIAAAHDGTIDAESAQGQGTRLRVRLPLNVPARALRQPQPAGQPPESACPTPPHALAELPREVVSGLRRRPGPS